MLTVAQIIAAEMAADYNPSKAEAMRLAAWQVMDDYPGVTAAQFGDEAASCGFHRQGAINRWNEAKADYVRDPRLDA